MNRHTGIRLLAGFMGIYHILMGILGIVSGSTAAWGARVLWHATVTVDPQFSYLAKFLGAYVVAFGVMMLFIFKDPVRYSGLVYPAVVVAVLRIARAADFRWRIEDGIRHRHGSYHHDDYHRRRSEPGPAHTEAAGALSAVAVINVSRNPPPCWRERRYKQRLYGSASGAGFVDHRFPDAFGLENEFYGFADCAVSGDGFRGVVCRTFNFGDRIAHGHGEAGAEHERNIRKVITDVCDSGVGDSGFSQDVFVGRHLHRLFHINELHLHFVSAAQECRTLAARDAAGAQAGGMRQGKALSVVGVKGLDFESGAVGLRQQSDTAVRHGSVYVHKE